MSTEITTIEALIDALDNLSKKNNVLDIMSRVSIPESEYERYYTWKHEHYTRNLLARTLDYELLLICWEKGQQSPIHDFHSNEAWIHPVAGKLCEERFIQPIPWKGLQKVSSVQLGIRDFSYMREISIHRFSNIHEGRSVSLNIYTTPVVRWRTYNETNGETDKKDTWYDSVNEELEILTH